MCILNPMVFSLQHSQNDSPVFIKKALEAENFLMGPVLQLKDYWQRSHSPLLAPGTENVDPNRANQIKTNFLSYEKLIHWIQGTVMPLYMGLSPCQLMLHHICVNLDMDKKKKEKYFARLDSPRLCGGLRSLISVSCHVSWFHYCLQQGKRAALSRGRVSSMTCQAQAL